MKPQNIIIASCLLLMCCIMSNLHASTFHPQNVRSNNDTIQAVRLKSFECSGKVSSEEDTGTRQKAECHLQ